MAAVLEARGLVMRYAGVDGVPIEVLAGLDLAVGPGEFVAVTGASGAGKSTLLHLLGALERPSAGRVLLEGTPYDTLDAAALAALRNRRIGFVFQFHHLLREFTALENVMMPLLIGGADEATAAGRARGLLEAVGLGARAGHRPARLSGGEQQRVAVARALAAEPLVVLADEPTGNLDWHTADALHTLFRDVARRFRTALVVVTHNPRLAALADRVLALADGRLVPAALPEAVA